MSGLAPLPEKKSAKALRELPGLCLPPTSVGTVSAALQRPASTDWEVLRDLGTASATQGGQDFGRLSLGNS